MPSPKKITGDLLKAIVEPPRYETGNGKAHGATEQLPWYIKPTSEPPVGITACDLLAKEFPPARFLVGDLLTQGLTILGGKPKHGKSWLALMLGWAVAAGLEVDGRPAWQGKVLYLALEDTQRRLQGRLNKLKERLGWIAPETLILHTLWPRADKGGLTFIREWLDDNKNESPRLVIIDTLAKFREEQKGSGNSYADDYKAIGHLKQLIDQYEVASLMLHHTRKLKSEDPFDEISGTLAITGAADSIWMLDTTKKGADANLYITGRDLPDATISMKFEANFGRWQLGSNQDGIDTSGRQMDTAKNNNKVEQCKTWLVEFLKIYAYPSSEIQAAAEKQGFSFAALRDAKAALGQKGTRQLWHHNFGYGGANDWWSGPAASGSPRDCKRRPTPSGKSENSGGSGDSYKPSSDPIPD
jgi:hypothetical protein